MDVVEGAGQAAKGLHPPSTDEDSPSPSNNQSRSRRPSVSNACERCRRRKIRCDENQPCATCARFRLTCVKQGRQRDRSRSTQSALEERIRRLEQQLDRAQQPPLLDDPSQLWPPFLPEPSQEARPELHIDTKIQSNLNPYNSLTDDAAFYNFSTRPSASSGIPTIEITQCEAHSPHPWSPSPSLAFSSSSRASSPEQFAISTPLLNAINQTGANLSPSINLGYPQLFGKATQTELPTHLRASQVDNHSRSSSFSSDIILPDALALPSAESNFFHSESSGITLPNNASLGFPALPQDGNPLAGFADQNLPSAEQAVSLSVTYFRVFRPSDPSYISNYQICLHVIYSLPSPASSPATLNSTALLATVSLTLAMARFHVFMTLAIAIRINIRQQESSLSQSRPRRNTEPAIGSAGSSSFTAAEPQEQRDAMDSDTLRSMADPNPLVDIGLMKQCYNTAMAQVSDSSFWDSVGGVEAADLMLKFAITRLPSMGS